MEIIDLREIILRWLTWLMCSTWVITVYIVVFTISWYTFMGIQRRYWWRTISLKSCVKFIWKLYSFNYPMRWWFFLIVLCLLSVFLLREYQTWVRFACSRELKLIIAVHRTIPRYEKTCLLMTKDHIILILILSFSRLFPWKILVSLYLLILILFF